MRWLLALGLVACSSSSEPSPTPSPKTPPTPTPPTPTVAADPLEAGHPIDKLIRAGEAHRYRIQMPAGNVATGAVVQNGIDVELVVFDPTGKQIADLDSPNGALGPEPFEIVATISGAYDIEVRPFTMPPGSPPQQGAPLSTEGRYEARLDAVLTADAYAERRATDRFDSPRVLALWKAAHAHQKDAIDALWAELAGKAPIVEPYPGDAKDVLVTFLFRSSKPYVALFGGPNFREKPLVRLEDSDVWFLTARMPADARFDYAFIAADAPPDYHVPYRPQAEQGRDPRFTLLFDPNNPMKHGELSRAELPGAPPQPWIIPSPDGPKGTLTPLTIESAQLKEPRRIAVYTPAGYDPKRRYPLVIVFDGEVYGSEPDPQLPLPTILDNLIAAKKIPPVVAALVANQGTRARDLPGSPAFSAFVADELVPRLRKDYRAGMTAAETIVTGSSLGGLCSTYTAFHHPDVIGNVLSQSGSYQFRPGEFENDVSEFVEGGPIVHELATSPRLPLRFYLDTGLFEEKLRDLNRHVRDVLVAKGYPLTYVEFSGGHDYWMWRHTIADGLIALLPH